MARFGVAVECNYTEVKNPLATNDLPNILHVRNASVSIQYIDSVNFGILGRVCTNEVRSYDNLNFLRPLYHIM